MSNPRVVNAHREAVQALLPVDDVAATTIAAAVLSATDDKTRYVVLVREPEDAGLTVFGPYLTYDAAHKALAEGHAFALRSQGAKCAIFPLTPSPKQPRKKKEKADG
jgi:hypothetical protein